MSIFFFVIKWQKAALNQLTGRPWPRPTHCSFISPRGHLPMLKTPHRTKLFPPLHTHTHTGWSTDVPCLLVSIWKLTLCMFFVILRQKTWLITEMQCQWPFFLFFFLLLDQMCFKKTIVNLSIASNRLQLLQENINGPLKNLWLFELGFFSAAKVLLCCFKSYLRIEPDVLPAGEADNCRCDADWQQSETPPGSYRSPSLRHSLARVSLWAWWQFR